MQKSVFAHFGVGLRQEGVAGSAAANFTSTSKASKNELSKLGLIAKAFKAAFSRVRHSVSGAFGRLFAAAVWAKSQICAKFSTQIQGKSLICERVAQGKAARNSAFKGLRISSLSRSLFRAF